MGEEDHGGWSPTGAPVNLQRDYYFRHFGNSVNAVSCGFIATAILISMFLVMALFERFLDILRRKLRRPVTRVMQMGCLKWGTMESSATHHPR